MNFAEYQEIIDAFAVYPRDNELTAISYLALGLNGEAGEVAEQLKKAIRNDGHLTPERRARILDEIGDVLWYITRIAIEFDSTIEAVAKANIDKLEQRRLTNSLKHE